MQIQGQTGTPVGTEEPGGAVPLAAPRGAPRRQLRGILANPKALVGVAILLVFLACALLAPIFAPGDPVDFVDLPHQPPSRDHVLGTTGQGQDVFAQTIWGARISVGVGFATGLLTTVLGVIVGMAAGYFGGWIDDLLSVMMNVVLIVPSLPLIVTLAAFLPPGPQTILFVLVITGWAWPARVFRAQTLSLREKDFVAAALVSGESRTRIIFGEVLPNMWSLVAANFFGGTLYAIGAEAGLEFLGLGNPSLVSWGTQLYWASTNSGLLTGAWWTFVPAGLAIALVAFALALINYAVDEMTNPRLRAERTIAHGFPKRARGGIHATPVIRNTR